MSGVTEHSETVFPEPKTSYVRKNFAREKINAPNYFLLKKDIVWKKEQVYRLRKRNEKLRIILSFYEPPIMKHLLDKRDDPMIEDWGEFEGLEEDMFEEGEYSGQSESANEQ